MTTHIIIAVIALLFAALFSGYEMAFLHCNRLKIALDKKEGKKYAFVMDKFINDEGRLISSLLMGNNIFTVVYGIAAAKILNPWITSHITASIGGTLILETIIATLVILITAEFLPKALCFLNPNRVFSSLYRVINFFYYLFYPATWLINKLSEFIIKIAGYNKKHVVKNNAQEFNETDLMNLSEQVEGVQDEESPTANDIEIFQNAVDFSTTKIKECLIPRTEITAIDEESSSEDLLKIFVDSGYSRVPVYRDTIDNIIGYVHSKDLLKKSTSSIKQLLRSIHYVSMDKDAQSLLEFMTKNRVSIVAVRDEYGGTEGIVTLEDLIEEIFGDINDELDKDVLIEKKISDDEYIFSARLEIKELNKKYDFELPESTDYSTIAGLIINVAEALPKEKTQLQIGKYIFTILKCSSKRIEVVSFKKAK
jgi:putative hemolysin